MDSLGITSKAMTNELSAAGRQSWVGQAVVLLVGLAVFTIPTMLFVAQESWTSERGAHGPIVLATGVWLLWRLWPSAAQVAKPAPAMQTAILLAVLMPMYLLTRVTQIVELEGYMMYAVLLAVLHSLIGIEAMKKLWFPLLYIGFIFPPPESLVDAVTLPMKMELSQAAVGLLDMLGYPVGGEGVRIYIGQYELLVAAACSGLNSIIALTAISLFYIYIRHQADWRYALLLVFFIIPVALAANFVRVIILILLTYYAGEAAAQGFLHNFAGIMMFAIALLFIFALDEVFQWVRRWSEGSKKRMADA